jgi:hypothetical protein
MAVSDDDRLYREDVFALEREVVREASILRAREVTPATTLQGYLSARWKRRDGNIYHPPTG